MDSEQLIKAIAYGSSPDEHYEVWKYIAEQMEPYPSDEPRYPWKQPKGGAPTRNLAVAHILTHDDKPLAVEVYCKDKYERMKPLSVGSDDSGIGKALFPKVLSGSLIVLPNAARCDFHLILRHYARELVYSGYRLDPIATSAEIRAIRVRRGKCTWWLVDFYGSTGLNPCAFNIDPSCLRLLFAWLIRYQQFLEQMIGSTMRLTIGSTAIAAAARCMPADDWLWRPPPFVVAMMRAGGGYRGGYAYTTQYRGPAYKYDQNRCYLHCLRESLPLRRAFGPCLDSQGRERPGTYVCTIQGARGLHPIYISPWHNNRMEPHRLFTGPSAVCVLPTSEFAGIRALGYRITPGWGAVTLRSITFAPYVEKLERIVLAYPRGSWQSSTAKALGNAVYGKFGEQPWRTSLEYALERPGKDWHPFITGDGLDVENLWCQREYTTRPHQQVDLAAYITGAARTKLYTMIARVREQGCGLLMADTDSITLKSPPKYVELDDYRLGSWRLEAQDDNAIIAGEHCYKIGELVRGFGERGTPELVELRYEQGIYTVGGQRLAAPWRNAS